MSHTKDDMMEVDPPASPIKEINMTDIFEPLPVTPKRVRVPSTVRHTLWKEYFGYSTKGICQCCRKEDISIMNFEAGHILSVKNGGSNHISNLKPVCSHCNKSMGTKNMIEFIKNHF
jgi:hypothetical protein